MGNCLCEDDVTVSASQFAHYANNPIVAAQQPANIQMPPQSYGYSHQGIPTMQPVPTVPTVPSRVATPIVSNEVRESVYPTNYSRVPTEGRGGLPLQTHFKKT